MKSAQFACVLMLVLESVSEMDAGQVDDCYSIENRTQSVEFLCQSPGGTEIKNYCVLKIFHGHGVFTSAESKREVNQIRINGCYRSQNYYLFADFRNVKVFDVSRTELNSLEYARLEYDHLQVFNASFNDLIEIPSEFFSKMPTIAVVDISHNKFKQIDKMQFSNMHKLSTLNMSNNKMIAFDVLLPERLQVLDISANQIKSIYQMAFNGLTEFEQLNIMNNQMQINDDLLRILLSPFDTRFAMENAEEIQIRRWGSLFNDVEISIENDIIFRIWGHKKEIRYDQNWFRQLRVFILEYNRRDNTKSLINLLGSSIEHLELSGSYIGEMDGDKFKEFNHLKKLILPNTGLKSFSLRHITNVTNLEVLDISANNVHQIDDAPLLANAINLKRFCAQGNQITNIEEVIASLRASIEYLDLSENILDEISKQTFAKMTNLTVLNLKDINLFSFNLNTIELLSQLQELDISKNNLRTIKSLSTLKNLAKLSKFDASDNKLENGGDLIRNLPSSLMELDISGGNFVGKITSNMFSRLSKLTDLNLSRTKLFSFDFNAIEHLVALKRLYIAGNGLKRVNFTLPTKNAQMNLYELHLNLNDLTEMDTLLPWQFPMLSTLEISRNRLSCHYLERFTFKWKQSHSFTTFHADGCINATELMMTEPNGEFSAELLTNTEGNSERGSNGNATKVDQTTTDRGSSSNVVLYVVPAAVLIVVIVAVIVAVLVLRRRRAKRSGQNVTYKSTEPANKMQFGNDARATTSISNARNNSTDDHIYEEIKETPVIYDRLRHDTDPMPLSQHTRNHYDNLTLLKRA